VAGGVDRVSTANGADRFVVRAPDGSAALYDAASLDRVAELEPPSDKTPGWGAVAPDGSAVVVGFGLWSGRDGHAIGTLLVPRPVDEIAFSPDGALLFAHGMETGLTVLDAATGKRILDRPAWERDLPLHNGRVNPDLCERVGDLLVIGHGARIESYDLVAKKIVATFSNAEKTHAVLAPKTGRVAVMLGANDAVRVWDFKTGANVRSFSFKKELPGATCQHCTLELDEEDEDRIFVVPTYSTQRFELRVSTGSVALVEHELAPDGVPSSTWRLSPGAKRACALVPRVARDASASRAVPSVYCDRAVAPGETWPYPGFDGSGAHLAVLSRERVWIYDVERGATVAVLGKEKL
jgi:hypothetical protein